MQGIYVGSLNEKKKGLLLKLKPDFIWINGLSKEDSSFLRRNNIKAFYSVGVFGVSSDEQKKGFSAIDKGGKPIKTYAGWYKGGCPSNDVLRKKRLKKIEKNFSTGYYDGIWLDSIRFPTYWETKEPEYLDTCYCEVCLKKYKQSDVVWKDFRVSQITSFLKDVKKIVRNKPLGYFAVPETEGRLYRVFSQPAKELEKIVNYVSPMIYPQMVGKGLNWVKTTLGYFKKIFGEDRAIPIAQVVKMPDHSVDRFGIDDLESVASIMLKGNHVSYFMLDQLIENKKRQEIVINLFKKGDKSEVS